MTPSALKKRSPRAKKRAFSLAESIVALALFASAAYVITTACYNCVYPLDMKPRDSANEFFRDFSVQKILAVKDYDAIDDGLTVETLDGDSSSITAEAEPTKIIDLFKIAITADGDCGFTETAYAMRPTWYQNSNDRSSLLDDLKREIEDRRDAVGNAESDENGSRVVYSLPISSLAESEDESVPVEAHTAFTRVSEKDKEDAEKKSEKKSDNGDEFGEDLDVKNSDAQLAEESKQNSEKNDGKKSTTLPKSGIELLKEKARASLDSALLRDSIFTAENSSGSSGKSGSGTSSKSSSGSSSKGSSKSSSGGSSKGGAR